MIKNIFALSLLLVSLSSMGSGFNASHYEDSPEITKYIERMVQLEKVPAIPRQAPFNPWAELFKAGVSIAVMAYKGYNEYSSVKNTVQTATQATGAVVSMAKDMHDGKQQKTEEQLNTVQQQLVTERLQSQNKDTVINNLKAEKDKLDEKERLYKSIIMDQNYEIINQRQRQNIFSLSELKGMSEQEENGSMADMFKKKFEIALADERKYNPNGDKPPLTPRSLHILKHHV